MKHNAKLIAIMTEKVFKEEIIDLLEKENVKGYTIFEGGGSGSFHQYVSQHSSMMDEFKIIKLEAIIGDAEVAERIATKLVNDFFKEKPGVVSLSDVEIFRAQKF